MIDRNKEKVGFHWKTVSKRRAFQQEKCHEPQQHGDGFCLWNEQLWIKKNSLNFHRWILCCKRRAFRKRNITSAPLASTTYVERGEMSCFSAWTAKTMQNLTLTKVKTKYNLVKSKTNLSEVFPVKFTLKITLYLIFLISIFKLYWLNQANIY